MRINLKFILGEKGPLSFLTNPYLPVFIGSVACLWLFYFNDSFWRDESKLLLNVINKPFFGLLGRLDYGQEAPLMFLWLFRILYLTGAKDELSYRFISLLATIGSMVLFQSLARNLIKERTAFLFVIWMFSLSPGIILFAAQAKQYALDLFFSVFILWLTSTTLLSSEIYGTRFSWLILTAILSPWFSLPSIFTVSILAVVIYFKANINYWRRLVFCILIIISCLMSGIVVLLRSFSPVQQQLASAFPVVQTQSNVIGYVSKISTFFSRVFFCYFGFAKQPYVFCELYGNEISLTLLVLIVLCSLGIMASFKRYGCSLPLLMAGPLTLASLLLLLRFYPTIGRAFLFGAPGLFLLMGFGLNYLYYWVKFKKILAVLLIMLILPCVRSFFTYYSIQIGGVRESLKFILHHSQEGGVVFCDSYAAPTVLCYKALKKHYATGLTYLNQPEEWIEGKINTSKIDISKILHSYDDHQIWLLVETSSYTRAPDVGLPVLGSQALEYLNKSRKIEFSYITPRVWTIGFSKVTK